MHLIVCVDDRRGMSFGSRRLSKDRAVFADILKLAEGKILRMSPYSALQFSSGQIVAEDTFLDNAQPGDICFVENMDVLPYLQKVNFVTMYYWNRRYPADLYFPQLEGWTCVQSCSFSGYSHENIIREVYQR